MLRLGKKKTACSVTLFSLKWYVRGRRGGLEDPAWRVPLYLVPQGGSRAETGLTVGRVPREGWRAQGVQFRAGGEGGCRRRGSGWPPRCGDFLIGGLFRDRHAWPRQEGTARARMWGVELDRSLGYEGLAGSCPGAMCAGLRSWDLVVQQPVGSPQAL